MDVDYFYVLIGYVVFYWILLSLIWKIIRCAKVYWLPKIFHRRIDLLVRYGSWAVITGSTDGIGKAYAVELAKRGINVVLISRTQEKLNLVAEQIRKQFNVKTKTIQADFSRGFSVYEHIDRELKDIPVGILVNNVGMFFSYPLEFAEVSPEQIEAIIETNISSSLLMTRMILPKMQEKRKGAIVFVSSICELHSNPLDTLYSSTKRFMKSFTEGLEPNCSEYGVTLQRLTPSFVKTNMVKFTERLLGYDNFVIPNVDKYTEAAVDTLGRSSVTSGFWPHEIQYFFASLMPLKVSIFVNGWFAKRFKRDYLRIQKRRMTAQEKIPTSKS